jgi:hypothetical protein
MSHDEAEQLLVAGAVLGDLEPDEQAAYDTHRSGCGRCRELEVELDVVLADLALVVPERMPPPDLLHGIRAAISAEASAAGGAPALTLVPAEAPSTATLPELDGAAGPAPASAPVADVIPLQRAAARRSQRLMVASLGLAAVLGIVAVGLGVRSSGLQQDLNASNARVTQLETAMGDAGAVATVAMNPSHLMVQLQPEAVAPNAEAAVMYVPGSTSSWIVAADLPATPAGSGYQLWYADAAGVHGLQTVAFDGNGTFMAPIDADLAAASAVMITLEQAGGATGDPGPQVVFGEL